MSGAWLCKKVRHPWLSGPPPIDHVLGDARLRDLKSELEQFAVDAWRAPKRIFHSHPPDQRAQLSVDLRSPSLWARLSTPVAAKAGPVLGAIVDDKPVKLTIELPAAVHRDPCLRRGARKGNLPVCI